MTKKKNTKEFIKQSNDKYVFLYDYSETIYIDALTKVCIICHNKDENGIEHGIFWQLPNNHLNGQKCPKCFGKNKLDIISFISKSNNIHNKEYDYSETIYTKSSEPVNIICHRKDVNGIEHGVFKQIAKHHLSGHGCPKCAIENNSINQTKSTEQYVEDCIKIHGDNYDYNKTIYTKATEKVVIICNKCKSEFKQIAANHLSGKGCPYCNQSKLEKNIKTMLIKNNIKFEEQKSFSWLKNKKNMFLDFYLPEYNIAIECQGEQHFKQMRWFGGEPVKQDIFDKYQQRDKLKFELCKDNNIDILYFCKNEHKPKEYLSTIYTKEMDLINRIKGNLYNGNR